jgi:hypothetical protein
VDGVQTSTERRLLRALPVLALLAGLLGMHGLAPGHHGVAQVAGAAAVQSTTDVAAHAAGALHGHAGAWQAPTDCDDPCSSTISVAALCLVVLTALAHTLHPAASRRPAVLPARRGPPRVVSPTSTATCRRLDVVSELCISRT